MSIYDHAVNIEATKNYNYGWREDLVLCLSYNMLQSQTKTVADTRNVVKKIDGKLVANIDPTVLT